MASPIINIKFLADLKQFSSQMQNANRSLDSMGKSMQKAGAGLTAGLTLPLVGLGAAAIKAFSEVEGVSNAFARLDDGSLLTDLRAATKGTVSDLKLMTAAVQAKNFEIPLSEMSTLLEFARRRAKDTGESVDYLVNSIVTGIGRKSPLILDNLGISAVALKDNLNGATAAASSISDVTKAVGKIARAELGKMGADTLTLNELWLQLKTITQNTLVDLGKSIASVVQPLLIPFIAKVKELAEDFRNLSPTTKKWIVILGGVAAAIGPLLALAGTILPAIGTGLALLTGPIGLIVAGLVAVGVVIYKNWAPIKQTLVDIANYFIELYNESTVFRAGVEAVVFQFKNLMDIGVFVFETLKNIIGGFIDNFINGFKTFGAVVKAALTGNFSEIPDILKANVNESKEIFSGFTDELANDWKDLTDGITKNGQEAIDNVVNRKKIAFIKTNIDATAIEEVVESAVTSGLAKGASGKGSGKPKVPTEDELELAELDYEQEDLHDVDIMTRFDIAATQAEAEAFGAMLNNEYQNFIEDIDVNFIEPFEKKMERVQAIAATVGSAVADTFSGLASSIVGSLGLADTGFQGFVKGLVGTITKLISMMLASSISQSIAGATASGTATGPGAVFATPAFIATAVGGVLAAFAAIPKFETGGVVGGSSFYGDKILARVNSNELILNTAQQKSLYNQLNTSSGSTGGPQKLYAVLKGSDIVLASEREQSKQNRRG